MRGISGTDARVRVLDFWWMTELFSPQPIPKLTGRSVRQGDQQVIEWRPGQRLPWVHLPPPPRRGKQEQVWRHRVYLGVYETEATYQFLHRMFHEDTDAYDERRGGRSACAAVVLDQDGRLLEGSAVLSAALWAVGRLCAPGPADPGWAVGFEKVQKRLDDAVDEFEGDRRERTGAERVLPQDGESLVGLRDLAHRCAVITDVDVLASPLVVISSTAVSAKRAADAAESAVESDFLNSLYLEDLSRVRAQVAEGNLGEALDTYLRPEGSLRVGDRVDVRQHPDVVDAATSITRLPKGRWPAKATHPLALSQQYAVNTAMDTLAPGSGLMGVNGPPGTGKTTMLRDLLAGNVVERARRLADLARPGDAFVAGETIRWVADGHQREVPILRPELTGFEMVVASANNTAVENITVEIPSRGAIDKAWHAKADYFADIATAVLGGNTGPEADPNADPEGPGAGAWGLVAARLGRKKFRSEFRSAFWFDKSSGNNTGNDTAKDKENDPALEDPATIRMQTRLGRWASNEVPHRSWKQAREAFRTAEERVDGLVAERRLAETRLADLPRLADQVGLVAAEIDETTSALRHLQGKTRAAAAGEKRAATDLAAARERHARHISIKPGIWETMFSLGRAPREWRTGLQPLLADLDAHESRHRPLQDALDRLREEVRAGEHTLETARGRHRTLLTRHDELRTACARDRDRYGEAYAGVDRSEDERERRAPWLDAELDEARSELFLAALDLHQDFLANGGWRVVKGMRAAIDVVGGAHPADLEPHKLLAAWQFFFLAVPLVSTTFASLGRMFAKLETEALGWLFIDEAGQTSPQYAVGGIWRARRVISVGDPLQLQPVVTIPKKAQRDIAHHYGIASTWIPPEASVQTLADRVARYGTTLPQGEEAVWVSAPLRVHRRCDDPMFTLCNQIAYDGLMVNGVYRRLDDQESPDTFDALEGPIVTRTRWLDSPAPTPGTHLQPNQIERLKSAIAYLHDKHQIGYADMIAISPFRSVANVLEDLPATTYPGLVAGTIHTAQGKEADVVFLVLGGDPDSPGAKAWAASSVNLVNVAASRAKRRLYVIGDREAWSKYNYFRQLASATK